MKNSLRQLVSALALSGVSGGVLADGGMNKSLGSALSPLSNQAAVEIVIFPAKKIITMEKDQKTAKAVAVSGKRILGVGTVEQLRAMAGQRAFRIDNSFLDKIVMPGFIDQHLHPVLGALTLATEIIATEDWSLPGRTIKAANTPDEYVSRLKSAEQNLKTPDEPLISRGYHKLWHGDLDRAALDKISSSRPIVIWQRSCHQVILTTAALKRLNITPEDLVEHTLFKGMGQLADSGALVIQTGEFTGRSPDDRFIVKDSDTADKVNWGKVNIPFDGRKFDKLWRKCCNYLKKKDVYVRDVHANASANPDYQLRIRVVTE